MRCPICLYRGLFPSVRQAYCAFSGELLLRHDCPNCGVVFGNQRMLGLTPQQLRKEYEQLYASGYENTDPSHGELDLFRIVGTKPKGVYLNWGAGDVSCTVMKARNKGIALWEYDPYVADKRPFLIKDPTHLAEYDAIVSNNLIEHLQDPVAALTEMRRHLKPGGVMAHRTACYDYVHEDTRYHLFFFLGRSVDVMSRRAGLVAERVSYHSHTILYRPLRRRRTSKRASRPQGL